MTTLLDILIIAFTILCSIAITTSLIVFISSKIKYWVIACSIPTEPKPDYLWKTMMDSRTPEEFQVEKDMAFVEKVLREADENEKRQEQDKLEGQLMMELGDDVLKGYTPNEN